MKSVQEKKQKKGIKEWFRKLIVSLKKRPHNIALIFMAITFVVYSFNLTQISETTEYVVKAPMGLCSFCVMLFSILAFVCFLNAFPKRKKPVLILEIVLYAMLVICIVCDILYMLKINERIAEGDIPAERLYIYSCRTLMIVHIIMLGVTALLIALIPVFGKLFNKIDTSVDLGEDTKVENLTLSSDE